MPNEELISLQLAVDTAYQALPERYRDNPMLFLDEPDASLTEEEKNLLLDYALAVEVHTTAQLRAMGFKQVSAEEARELLDKIIEDNTWEQVEELRETIQEMTDRIVEQLENFKIEIGLQPFDEESIHRMIRDTFPIPQKRRRFRLPRWFRRG